MEEKQIHYNRFMQLQYTELQLWHYDKTTTTITHSEKQDLLKAV